jgi:hypothetical protein
MALIQDIMQVLGIPSFLEMAKRGRGGGGGGGGKAPAAAKDPYDAMREYALKKAIADLTNPDKAVNSMNLDNVPKVQIGGDGGGYRPPQIAPGILSGPRR